MLSVRTFRPCLVILSISILLVLAGCGGASQSTPSGGNKNSVAPVVTPTPATLAIGATQQFSATENGAPTSAVNWSVDGIAGGNSTVGTVNTSGLYTAPSAAGTHNVAAALQSNSSLSANAAVAVVSLTLSPQTANVSPTGTAQFTATVQGTSNTAVSWSVDGVAGGNSTVGTISSSGLYTAPAMDGSHTVTATTAVLTNYSANAGVTVTGIIPGTVSVLTFHNNDVRDGVNSNETVLNLSNVNPQQFGKLFALPVDGQVYAQPLYIPNLMINGAQHNVIFIATENDSVYAFDADAAGPPLWKKHLGTPVPVHDQEGIDPLLGITSTPVIDPISATIYVVTDGLENSHKIFRLHALDLATGGEKFGGPAQVTGTVQGTGWGSNNGQITLETSCYQRDGLALDEATNAVYIGFGHCDHGWILGYDKASLQQTAILNMTPDGAGGGLWGGTPAIDNSTGDLYLISGVDLGDPAPDYNDSAVRLSASDLSIIDYFKPSNEAYLRSQDADFGSGSPIIMPNNGSQYPHELIGGGKDGRIFVMNRDNMGQYQTTDHVIQEVQTGTRRDDNIFSTPTFFNGTLYYHCDSDVVKAYRWDSNTGLLSTDPISHGNDTFGVHGATSSLSSNGTSDAILWEIESTNAPSGGPAILHAYSANNLQNELYKSSHNSNRDQAGAAVKFTVPTVADGRVYVGTAAEVDVYGLLSQ